MKKTRVGQRAVASSYRARCVVTAALIFAALAPVGLSALVSAAQVTERSVELSSSSISASNVTYTIHFTAAATAGAFVVDFCSNSPVIGEACTAPSSFDASAAASTSPGFTDVEGDTSKVIVTGTIDENDAVSVALTGLKNPDTAGPLYARIVTFDTKTDAEAYSSTAPGANRLDEGGVAIAITPTVGVSGTVLESMTFCVSGDPIGESCTVTGKAPTLNLGETSGEVTALDVDHVSTGVIYTQISTNAASGGTVSLKSNAFGCGGLRRAGSNDCDIAPALDGGVAAGQARFGVKTATATDTGTNASGSYQPADGSIYGNSAYALHYEAGDATGVTSVFGDPFLDTAGAPVNNKNMMLTFGASISNNTPAGSYSTDLSLIATGKF